MDNSTWTPEEQSLINLEAKVEYILIPRESEEFNKHLELVHEYTGRHEHNYKADAIENGIKNHNRFNIGALLIKIDGELSRSLMLEKYNDWMLLSRLISHNHPKLPLLTVHGNGPIMDIALVNGCKGIFATLNNKNRMYLRCIDTSKFRMFNENNPLFNKHLEVICDIKRLEEPKIFMYVPQYILYRELSGKITDLFGE